MATGADGTHSGDSNPDDPRSDGPHASGPPIGGSPSGAHPFSGGGSAEPAASRSSLTPRHWMRSVLSGVLIVLAAVLAPLSAVAVWIADEIGDTDRYVATVAPLASRPDVQAAVTDSVTDAIVARVGLDTLLSGVVPGERPRLETALGPLKGPITGGIKDFVHQTVASFVASDAFATLWKQVNRQAHAAFTGALTGESDSALRIKGDTVTLDLAPVVAQVKRRLTDRGFGVVVARVPSVRTEFTLAKSKDIRRARTGFRALQFAGNWLPAVTVVLAGAGVLLAVRRRRALVTAALAVAAGVAVLGVGLAFFRVIYLDHLPARTNEQAAGTVYDQLVRFLRVTVRMVIVLGVVVALGTWLSGAGRWAGRVRAIWESGIAAAREAAGVASTGPVGPWVHRHRLALRWGVVLVAVVVFLLWSYPTGMVIFWIALAALGALAAVEFLDDRRQRRGARMTPM
jgi:hypothetical protein